ncbi:MAG TPA: chromate transporter, partial [Polyangiaceae bacterium]|nr:chromate transporter [Polyangiaceae bacterium]
MSKPPISSSPVDQQLPETTSLLELALLFVRLGSTAFGGPAAHIAMMQDEVVTRRKWLT